MLSIDLMDPDCVEKAVSYMNAKRAIENPADMINDRTFTRADETAALQKIRAILEKLPEDSYVKTAFTGCVGLAEYNIRNDFLLSYPARIEHLENLLYERSVK